MDLAHLKNNKGARHRGKRLGCGIGSGHGKTSGRGGKGQTARKGSSIRPGFEGGQMPLYRRLPKRGFTSFTLEEFAVVNVGELNEFSEGSVVTPASLKASGLVHNFENGIKILGEGELKKKLTVVANAFSNSAIKKIVSASGQCRVLKMADGIKDFDGVVKIDVKATVEAKPWVPAPKVVKAPKPKVEKVAKEEAVKEEGKKPADVKPAKAPSAKPSGTKKEGK